MSRYEQVSFGDVLTSNREKVDVEESGVYRMGGIRSFGKGIFERPTIAGSETRYPALFQIRAGQLVFSKLFAWEGALAVAEEQHDGLFFSSEFPMFDVDRTRMLPTFAKYLTKWPTLHYSLRGSTTGVGNRRQRVHPDSLLAMKIPLPELDEQRHIVAKLDATSHFVGAVGVSASDWRQHVLDMHISAIDSVINRAGSGPVKVRDVANIVNDLVRPGMDPGPARKFVGLEHLDGSIGSAKGCRPIGYEKGRKFRFVPNDLLYGYLRPYQNKVWLADDHGLCSVEQFVLRFENEKLARYFSHGLRGRTVLDRVNRLTNNLQLPRLRAAQLLDTTLPLSEHNLEDALVELDALQERTVHALRAISRRDELLGALRPSLLNAAFSGQL